MIRQITVHFSFSKIIHFVWRKKSKDGAKPGEKGEAAGQAEKGLARGVRLIY